MTNITANKNNLLNKSIKNVPDITHYSYSSRFVSQDKT
jgi:hypothetical protein